MRLCSVRFQIEGISPLYYLHEIYEFALEFQRKCGSSSKDAIHLACAYFIQADYFLSCDDKLVRQAKKLGLNMEIQNPVEYVREVDL